MLVSIAARGDRARTKIGDIGGADPRHRYADGNCDSITIYIRDNSIVSGVSETVDRSPITNVGALIGDASSGGEYLFTLAEDIDFSVSNSSFSLDDVNMCKLMRGPDADRRLKNPK